MKTLSKANLKVFWILLKVKLYTFFKNTIKVSFINKNGSWYCDIPGWPEEYFPNTLMVGDASKLIHHCGWGFSSYVNFSVKISNKDKDIPGYFKLTQKQSSLTGGAYYYLSDKLSNVWLCPVTLFVLGKYPKYIYFKPELKVEAIDISDNRKDFIAYPSGYNSHYVELGATKEEAIKNALELTETFLF